MIIDNREPKNLIQKLEAKKIPVELDFIESGDYLLSDGYAIERKTIQDMVASISDKRLFNQLNSLIQYDNPVLAIINDNKWEAFYFCHNRYIHNVYIGTMTTILLSYPKIKIIQFDTENEFVSFIASLDKKLKEDGKHERPKPMQRKAESLQERKENCLAAIQGVGIATAKRLLEKFGSIKKIADAQEEELLKIEKLGEKTIINIRETLN